MRVERTDGRGEAQYQSVGDRLAREATLEGLKEWTEYRVSLQAYNAIGPGPWSASVKARTRESGEAPDGGREGEGGRERVKKAERERER